MPIRTNSLKIFWTLQVRALYFVVTWRDKTQPTQKVAFLLDWTSSRSALELLFPIEFCLLTFVFNLRPVSICNLISIFQHVKVHVSWRGHKCLQNINHRFVLCSNVQIYSRDFTKFCGLLRIYELYGQNSTFLYGKHHCLKS